MSVPSIKLPEVHTYYTRYESVQSTPYSCRTDLWVDISHTCPSS